jgi:hypothetical protein
MRSITLRSLRAVIVLIGLTTAVVAAATITTAQAQATDADEHGNGDGEYLVGTGIYDMYVPILV